MIVVSNTSPISNLALINHLHLLQHLYGQIFIPTGVQAELMKEPSVAANVAASFNTFITPVIVKNQPLLQSLLVSLDRGEAEAIALTKELSGDLLLIDERLGRGIALQNQLNITGLLGVLLVAKSRSLIIAVKPLMDDLINIAGFRISSQLYQQVCATCGE
ncbi:MAG: DUF3368 domain-containing protein [Blastocatellia bacterium]